MNKYHNSSRLIRELAKNLDSVLISFFLINYKRLKFPYHDLKEVVYDILTNTFKGLTTKNELIPIINTLKNSRYKKKIRWASDYTSFLIDYSKGVGFGYEDKIPDYIVRAHDECLREGLIQTEIKKVNEWKEDSDSHLIAFPGIHQVGKSSAWSAFKMDVAIFVWKYMLNNLKGNLNTFYRSYPEYLIESPFFSPSSFNLALMSVGDELLEETVTDDDGNSLLSLVVPERKLGYKSMDSIDLKVLQSYFSLIKNDFYSTRTVSSTIGEITNLVYGYRPGQSNYEAIAERSLKLTNYNYKYIGEDKGLLKFNFLDNVHLDCEYIDGVPRVDGNTPVEITFGTVLANAIIKRQLINVTERNYSLLELPMSKIIYYALERERIALYNTGHTSNNYPYSFFQKIVRFKSKNKSENLKYIEDSLKDFINNSVCLESYDRLPDGSFDIQFKLLEDDELEELNFNK